MPYQSFSDRPGSSKSEDKFTRLHLPPLKNKSLLDIGCNEGFFCDKAHQLGASRVLGIDRNEESIKNAKERFPHLEFRCQSWDVLPDEKFDIILLLSAIHYAKDQKALLDRISSALAPGGKLILECGVLPGEELRWINVNRALGNIVFPTRGMLEQILLKDFAFRHYGRSIDQKGDPVPRYVYHATPFQPILILVNAPGKSGKTTLSRELAGVEFFSLDKHLGLIVKHEKTALSDFLEQQFNSKNLNLCYKLIEESEFLSDFVESIFDCIPVSRISGIEGAGINLPKTREAIIAKALEKGFFLWELERLI